MQYLLVKNETLNLSHSLEKPLLLLPGTGAPQSRAQCPTRQHLPRVHDPIWIEGVFDTPHRVHSPRAQLLLQVLGLPNSDPMLPRACSCITQHRQRELALPAAVFPKRTADRCHGTSETPE